MGDEDRLTRAVQLVLDVTNLDRPHGHRLTQRLTNLSKRRSVGTGDHSRANTTRDEERASEAGS